MVETSSDIRENAIRADAQEAHDAGWRRLAGPGTWWDGAMRLKIVAEARRAARCDLCARRGQALSADAVEGRHDTAGELPDFMIDVIHRVRNDASRITESWVQGLAARGLSEEQYVELIGVIATTIALDTFRAGTLGAPLELPAPRAGEPSRHRPAGAKRDLAWVATLAPEDVGEDDPNPYTSSVAANIHRALSLVPEEVRGFFALVEKFYLPSAWMRDFGTEYRAITHAQSELIAARLSAINRCIY